MSRFILLVFLALTAQLQAGCLTGVIANSRRDRVEEISRFDSNCAAMTLVEQMGNRHYKFKGCGYLYTYVCHDRGTATWWPSASPTSAIAPCQ